MDRPAGAEEKEWGWAEKLWEQSYARDDGSFATRCRVVRVFIRAGGFSSIHRHKESSNIFSVLSGRLKLRDYTEAAQPIFSAECSLNEGDHPITFPPNSLHQFEAITDVVALEIYIATPQGDASPIDIERFSQNGIKPPETTEVKVRHDSLFSLPFSLNPNLNPPAKMVLDDAEGSQSAAR